MNQTVLNENVTYSTELLTDYLESQSAEYLYKYKRAKERHFLTNKKKTGFSIIDLIIQVLKEELNISIDNRKDGCLEFKFKLPNSYLIMNITNSDIDGMICISAVYPFLYKDEYILPLIDLISRCNSSSEIMPLGKILLKRNVQLIAFENQYICKSPQDFKKDDFLTYLSATVVSAGRLYGEISKYTTIENGGE